MQYILGPINWPYPAPAPRERLIASSNINSKHVFDPFFFLYTCSRCYSIFSSFSFADCYVITVEHLSWSDVEAVVAMSFSAIGLVATFITFGVFIRFNDTPVVKASTRELSYLILVGMTLAHISASAILYFNFFQTHGSIFQQRTAN